MFIQYRHIKIMLRTYKHWTTQEDRQLKLLHRQKKQYHEIASALNRTEDAVKARIIKQCIYPLYDDEYLHSHLQVLSNNLNMNVEDFKRYLKYAGYDYDNISLSTIYSSSDEDYVPSDVSDNSETSEDTNDNKYDELLVQIQSLHAKIDKILKNDVKSEIVLC